MNVETLGPGTDGTAGAACMAAAARVSQIPRDGPARRGGGSPPGNRVDKASPTGVRPAAPLT